MTQDRPTPPRTRTDGLGLSWAAIAGLAFLGVPRAVLHDLDLVQEGTLVNALLVAVPPLVWVVVALAARIHRPFATLVVIGLCYGLDVAIIHQSLWPLAFEGDPPRLGGNLADVEPATQEGVIRFFAVLSSIATGALVGAAAGAVAALLGRARGVAGTDRPKDLDAGR